MKNTISFLIILLITVYLGFSQDNLLISNHPVYVYSAKDIDGNLVKLDKFRGKVLLIVNVASKCGYTPQYKGLEELYKKYKDKGFEILAFPCNQFRGQEPGTNKEIKQFCEKEYSVTFPLFSKIEVNGEDASPLYKYLTYDDENPIRWNFTKFLINRKGAVSKRFSTETKPMDIAPEIKKLLK